MPLISDHHSSVVVVTPEKSAGLFLFGSYDSGYPVIPLRNTANLLGGNHESNDNSPKYILFREITEEFSVIPGKENEFAEKTEIEEIGRLILKNSLPFQDFYICDPEFKKGKTRTSVVSFYSSQIPLEAFDWVDHAIKSEKRVIIEGKIKIAGLDDLISGRIPLAWSVPPMLSHYLRKVLPNPFGSSAIPLGKIRETLADYLKDFDYNKPVRK